MAFKGLFCLAFDAVNVDIISGYYWKFTFSKGLKTKHFCAIVDKFIFHTEF